MPTLPPVGISRIIIEPALRQPALRQPARANQPLATRTRHILYLSVDGSPACVYDLLHERSLTRR